VCTPTCSRSVTRFGDTSGFGQLIASTLVALTVLAPSGAEAQAVVGDREQQQGAPTWEALRARPYPQWFRDAKLGIFIHWGVYSVPAYCGKEQYGEWFLRGLQIGDTLRTRFMHEQYGPDFDYRDFAPLFRAELFAPDEWADLFWRAGARHEVHLLQFGDQC